MLCCPPARHGGRSLAFREHSCIMAGLPQSSTMSWHAWHACNKFAAGVREMVNDVYGETTAHNLHSSGRILLNIWRAMQTELKLPIYNLEACLAAVLRMRVPDIPAYVISGAVSDAYCLCMHAMVGHQHCLPHQHKVLLVVQAVHTTSCCLQPKARAGKQRTRSFLHDVLAAWTVPVVFSVHGLHTRRVICQTKRSAAPCPTRRCE